MSNVPEDRLKVGDMIRFDVGCLYKGYLTDMSRTFSFGPPDDKFTSYYNAVLKGQDLALSLVKPGKIASEIFNDTVAEVRETGIPHYGRQHVGHGIGLGLGGYDRPTIAPGRPHSPGGRHGAVHRDALLRDGLGQRPGGRHDRGDRGRLPAAHLRTAPSPGAGASFVMAPFDFDGALRLRFATPVLSLSKGSGRTDKLRDSD
ncbi:Uncharacterized peptidase SSP1059 [Geodia barretti]|uniref:Uncharacterized peptidase SSP1059 n=1 Tax=Geodia barretti TaxID=519541 RepID=A0AA35W733_GEOBA|nr:Uncharacterized peptidase SSP1059 [Geodia barretti]